jgi:hypothetical protein
MRIGWVDRAYCEVAKMTWAMIKAASVEEENYPSDMERQGTESAAEDRFDARPQGRISCD